MSAAATRRVYGARAEAIPHAVLRDGRLSLRALGTLCHLLALPGEWRTSADELARYRREGRDAVRAALRELEDAGYLYRWRTQDRRGRWSTTWLYSDDPQALAAEVEALLTASGDGSMPVEGPA